MFMYNFKIDDKLRGDGEEFIVTKVHCFGGDAELKYMGLHKYNLGDKITLSMAGDYECREQNATVISVQDIQESRYTKYTTDEIVEEVITYVILTVTSYETIEHQVDYLNERKNNNFDATDFIDIRKSLRDSVVDKLSLSKKFYNDIRIGNERFEDAANDMIFAFNSIGRYITDNERQRVKHGIDLFKKFCFTYL